MRHRRRNHAGGALLHKIANLLIWPLKKDIIRNTILKSDENALIGFNHTRLIKENIDTLIKYRIHN